MPPDPRSLSDRLEPEDGADVIEQLQRLLWECHRAASDSIPVPFDRWLTDGGPAEMPQDVKDLREAYDTIGEQEHGLRAGNEALKAERDRAVETRENANTVSVRVEAENARLTRLLNDRDNALFMVAQHLHRATEEITKYEASISLAIDEKEATP